MKRILFPAILWLFIFAGARAAEVNLTANADKKRAELGETVVFQVQVNLTGYTQFTPRLEIPPFEGFQIQGQPRQQQGMNWVNGQVSNSLNVVWELIPIKSGRLKIGPVTLRLKDPAQGEIVKQAPAMYVDVARAAALFLKPTPTLEPGATPGEEDELRPLKPDLGFPWERLGLILLGFGAVLALALFLALRPAKPKPVEVARHPGQIALVALEEARFRLKTEGNLAYFKEVNRILREYFKARFLLHLVEPTLMEIRVKAKAWLGASLAEGPGLLDQMGQCFELLVLVLFANHDPQDKEADQLGQWARNLILRFEQEHEDRSAEGAQRRSHPRTKTKER